MKITTKKYHVEFSSYEEACCFVALYAGAPGDSAAYRALHKLVLGYDEAFDLPREALTAALLEAARQIVEYNS